MLISIIIPTFNRARYLPAAIDSVLSQGFDDCEVIVVDDGSTDDSLKLLAAYGQRIRVLTQANAGAGAARNLGIGHAVGEYVAFLDSDDLWFPWSLRTLRDVIEQTGRPSVIHTAFEWIDNDQDGNRVRQTPLTFEVWTDGLTFAGKHPLVGAGSTVARLDCLRAVGGFAPKRIVGEDIDLLLRLGDQKGFVQVHSPPMFAYRRHAVQTTGSVKPWYEGAVFMLEQERQHHYPGGDARRQERRAIMANGTAYRSLVCLKMNSPGSCLKLYVRSFALQCAAGNWDYLWKTPARVILNLVGLWPPRTPAAT